MGIVSPNLSGGFDVSNIVPAEEFFCNRDTSCCFTGHRDRDLPFGGDVHKQGMKNLLSMLPYFYIRYVKRYRPALC